MVKKKYFLYILIFLLLIVVYFVTSYFLMDGHVFATVPIAQNNVQLSKNSDMYLSEYIPCIISGNDSLESNLFDLEPFVEKDCFEQYYGLLFYRRVEIPDGLRINFNRRDSKTALRNKLFYKDVRDGIYPKNMNELALFPPLSIRLNYQDTIHLAIYQIDRQEMIFRDEVLFFCKKVQ
jgi:hypothetical protein